MKWIGRYHIQGLLGKGGMGRVYKVMHPTIGRFFALKRLQPSKPLEGLVGAKRLRALFLEEIQRMTSIAHPNILAVLDAEFIVQDLDYRCQAIRGTRSIRYALVLGAQVIVIDPQDDHVIDGIL